MTTAQFQVQRPGHDGSPVVIVVAGEIDMANAPDFEASVAVEIAAGDLALDLSEVSFMDSSAIAVIVRARGEALDRGHELSVRNPSNPVRRLLELVALDVLIEGEEQD